MPSLVEQTNTAVIGGAREILRPDLDLDGRAVRAQLSELGLHREVSGPKLGHAILRN